MNQRIPVPGEFYRCTDGALYQIKMIAKNSDTKETEVIYQEMFSPFQCWVKPLKEFLHLMERSNQAVTETYGADSADSEDRGAENDVEADSRTDKQIGKETVDDAALVRALQSGQPERYLSGRISEREIAERGCMKILDAETFHEKRQLMVGMKPYLDKRLLHNIAAALDIVLEETDLESQYDSLLHCLDTMEHFEGGRLR